MAKRNSWAKGQGTLEWNRVTWYSRLAALLVFLLMVPAVSFYVGTQYERTMEALAHADAVSNA